jgi:hypothetical protein
MVNQGLQDDSVVCRKLCFPFRSLFHDFICDAPAFSKAEYIVAYLLFFDTVSSFHSLVYGGNLSDYQSHRGILFIQQTLIS